MVGMSTYIVPIGQGVSGIRELGPLCEQYPPHVLRLELPVLQVSAGAISEIIRQILQIFGRIIIPD